MKVFKIYFLSLLLIFAFPVVAQENTGGSEIEPEKSVSEEDAEEEEEEEEEEAKAEAEKPAEVAPAEVAPAEVAPVEAKPVVVPPSVVTVPVQEKTPENPVEPKVDVKVESDTGENGKDEEKEEKKFSVSLTNGFSHGLSKERKSFVYNLSLGASYSLPWSIAMSAGVGLNAMYRYDMEKAVALESGDFSGEKLDSGKFDGTPLNIGFSRPFPLFWEIGGSLGINVGLPFTSTELWEQYKIYTMLSVDLGLMRSFKVAKETSIITSFSFDYTKTFAKEDYAWDDYDNNMLSPIGEHSFSLGLRLALAYKELTLAIGGGLSIERLYSSSQVVFYPGDENYKPDTEYQEWNYGFNFSISASYKLKDWNFALGAMTNAPESDSGNYAGYNAVPGDAPVNNGTANYPLKAKYTRVFANIGYSYSF